MDKMANIKLPDDTAFFHYKQRFLSFTDWPFQADDGCNCTPEKMAEAGFYFIGTSSEPDLVRCYYCQKEMDGWEPEDTPWEEHKRGHCPYIQLGKKPDQLLVEDTLALEGKRWGKILDNIVGKKLEADFQEKAALAKEAIMKFTTEKSGRKVKRKRT